MLTLIKGWCLGPEWARLHWRGFPASARDLSGQITMTGSGRLYALDGLRMVGALAVMASHLFPLGAHYGYLGVELFFLISGFVILMSAQKATLAEFAVARFVRLFPAFWICCTLTWLICEQGTSPQGWLANMLTLGQVHGLDAVYWTLGWEVRFYALIACLILTNRLDRIEWFLWAWLALALVPFDETLSGLLMVHTAGCFVGGCGLYLLRNPSRARYALVFCAWLVQLQNENVRVFDKTGQWLEIAMLVTLAFGAVFLASRVKGARWMLYLGGLSYPLYLLHNRIGLLFQSDYGWFAVPAVILLATGAYKLEKPLQKRVRSALVMHTAEHDDFAHETGAHQPRQTARASDDGAVACER